MKEKQLDSAVLILTVLIILIALISAFTKSVNITGNAVSIPVCNGVIGDINNDGNIEPVDLVHIQRMISGEETETLCADANGDGQITQEDIDLLSSRMIF